MFENYPDIISIRDMAKMLGIGTSSAYSLLKNNKIPHIRIGRKYIIPKQSVIGFIDEFCYNNKQVVNSRLNIIEKG